MTGACSKQSVTQHSVIPSAARDLDDVANMGYHSNTAGNPPLADWYTARLTGVRSFFLDR